MSKKIDELNARIDAVEDARRKPIEERMQSPEAYEAMLSIASGAIVEGRELQAQIDKMTEIAFNLEKQVRSIRATMPKFASILASAGSYPHKEKNEAILGIVARMLSLYESDYTDPSLDDIPF